MTVPITGSVKDVTGVEDNETPWSFASVIRFADDGSVITEKPREVRAVSGNLKVNLVPGYAIVTYGKHVWQVDVPETPTTLKALIEAGVAFPPDTDQERLIAAVTPIAESVGAAAAESAAPAAAADFWEAQTPEVVAGTEPDTVRQKFGDTYGPNFPAVPGLWEAIADRPIYTVPVPTGSGSWLFEIEDTIAAASTVANMTTAVNVGGPTQYPVKATVMFPPGLYNVEEGIEVPEGVDLIFQQGAVIRATAAMTALLYSPASTLLQQQSIIGGRFDCAELAQNGIDLRYFANIKIRDTEVIDFASNGYVLGDTAAYTHSYGALINNIITRRNRGDDNNPPVGSRCLWVRNASDNEISSALLHGGEVGVRTDRGGNTYSHVHPWGHGMKTNFDDDASGTIYMGCSADSGTEYGWYLRRSGVQIIAGRAYRYSGSGNSATALYLDSDGPEIWAHINTITPTDTWATLIGGPGFANFTGEIEMDSQVFRSVQPHMVSTINRRAQSGSTDVEQWMRGNNTVMARVTFTGDMVAPVHDATGQGGATVGSRLVGGTAGGPPASGTFEQNDVSIAADGTVWVCTAGGTPGTWKAGTVYQQDGNVARVVRRSASGTADLDQWLFDNGTVMGKVTRSGELQLPMIGATDRGAGRYRGCTTSGAPTSGASLVGDFVTSLDGKTYVCTASGTPGTWVPNDVAKINAQTGTSYTLTLSDAGALVTLDNSSAVSLEVPTNGTVPFPVGTTIKLAQLGSGQVTVSSPGGATINATPGAKISARYGTAELVKLATNTWLLTGNLAA